MELIAVKFLIGLVIGFLVGVTGLGGGVLLLPLLIFGLRVPAIIAVGSDAVFNFFTKIPSGAVHMLRGTVLPRVVLTLALGSVPGSILGVRLLEHLRAVHGDGVNDFIKSAVGILLIAVALLLLLERRMEEQAAQRAPRVESFAGMAVIGLVAGFLVGMTSVGSGTIIMMLMILFYRYAPKVMVGTDIVHAVVLTAVTGLSHYRLGNVDVSLVSCLLAGSIPGSLAGSYLGTRLPMPWLRRILCAMVLATGARMLWAPMH